MWLSETFLASNLFGGSFFLFLFCLNDDGSYEWVPASCDLGLSEQVSMIGNALAFSCTWW